MSIKSFFLSATVIAAVGLVGRGGCGNQVLAAAPDSRSETAELDFQDEPDISLRRPPASIGESDVLSRRASATNNGMVIRAPEPQVAHHDDERFFQIAVGPSFANGLNSSRPLTDLSLAYHNQIAAPISLSGSVDANIATGADRAQFIDIAVGVERISTSAMMRRSQPYVGADLGYAFVRNNDDVTENGLAAGVGTGVRIGTNPASIDVNLHYSVLTAQLRGSNPSVFGVRAAANF